MQEGEREQRQKSLKKLHSSILAYELSPDCKKAMVRAKQQLRDAIEFKYLKSECNRTYVFPVADREPEEYSSAVEVVNLHLNAPDCSQQKRILAPKLQHIKTSLGIKMELESRQESRNRPKIKLVKNRGGARQKTDYDNYRGDNRATVREHLKNPAESYLSHNSKYDQGNVTVHIPCERSSVSKLKERLQTDNDAFYHDFKKKQRQIEKAHSAKKLEEILCRFAGNRFEGALSEHSKSKLSLLSKSYLQLTSSKNLDNSELQNKQNRGEVYVDSGCKINLSRNKTETSFQSLKLIKLNPRQHDRPKYHISKPAKIY